MINIIILINYYYNVRLNKIIKFLIFIILIYRFNIKIFYNNYIIVINI